MLDIKKISPFAPYSDEWWAARLGKMTSSKIFCLCGDRGIGDGGNTYIRSKVHEKLTGISTEKNFDTEDTIFGITNEPFSINNYAKKYNAPLIIVSKHIVYDELFTATPDFFVINKDYGDNYDCETGETKSYRTNHLLMCECDTPPCIKKVNKQLYWQVISQMMFANVIVGNATFYNPEFEGTKALQHRVVFRKIDLMTDFKLLKNRMEEARIIYNNLYNKWK